MVAAIGEPLPRAWYDPVMRYHAVQHALWRTPSKRVAVLAGRGSGKTEIARRYIVRHLPIRKAWVDPIYVYAMPTYSQVKRVAWEQTLRLIPPQWIKGDPNKTEMYVDTIFGSRLYFVGMDKPERIEGLQIDGVIVDESSDQKPGSYDRTFVPMFTHRDAWAWRIGVPKRFGVGAVEFREYFEKGLQGIGGVTSFTWSSEDILTPAQLQDARDNLDAVDYDEAFRANWHTAGGSIFHAFDFNGNVRSLKYNPELPLLIGSDFNVNPMCWSISQDVGENNHTIDEMFIRNCNTQQALDNLWARYGAAQRGGWEFYGDAAGKARDTSASQSDYLQIVNDKRFVGKKVYYPKSNPLRKDRFSACNAALCNASHKRRCLIDPKCRYLINDLRTRSYKPGKFDPNDSADTGHISDAWGYMVYKRYPIKFTSDAATPGITFVSE